MNKSIDELINLAFQEDMGELGDITSLALIDELAQGEGSFIAEEDSILSGIDILKHCFFLFDHSVIVSLSKTDGDFIEKGQEVATVKGRLRSLLAVERTALNFVSHLSGIATATRAYAEQLKETNTILKDTRKTIPGLRVLEKEAVEHGGGLNHRIGLYDAILIKDNHLIDISVKDAVIKAREHYPSMQIEVEVENMKQIKEALEADADILLLDNMDEASLKDAVAFIDSRAKTEASGGITLENIKTKAQSGVDYISTSAITMAAPPISFKFEIS